MNRTIVPPRQRQFLYKAKGKARAKSPSPPLPLPPSLVFASQTGASASYSRASNYFSAPAAGKHLRTPESPSDNDDDDDDDTSEPPTKRQKTQKGNKPRPLVREGAFYNYPTPATHSQEEDTEPQTVPVNLVKRFLDQVQDLDVSRWLPRTCDPFTAERDNNKDVEDDDWAENRFWTLRAEPQSAARRRRPRRGARADSGVELGDAMQLPALGSTNSWE